MKEDKKGKMRGKGKREVCSEKGRRENCGKREQAKDRR